MVVGRPSGKEPLNLPKRQAIERAARPKEILVDALLAASGTTGRRVDKEKRAISTRRRLLLERSDIEGPVRGLPPWQRLEKDITDAVSAVLAAKKSAQ